jgi:hypothetical protein
MIPSTRHQTPALKIAAIAKNKSPKPSRRCASSRFAAFLPTLRKSLPIKPLSPRHAAAKPRPTPRRICAITEGFEAALPVDLGFVARVGEGLREAMNTD